MPSFTEFDNPKYRPFLAWLDQAVADHVVEYRQLTGPDRILALGDVRREFGTIDTEEGFALIACGTTRGGHADPSADLIARGLALLAWQPGGVKFCGRTYEAGEIIARRLERHGVETEAACAQRAGNPEPMRRVLADMVSEWPA